MDQVRDHFAPLGKLVLTSMEFELADKPEYRISDHAGGYETAMMLALSLAQVNQQANVGLEREDLGIASSLSVTEATGEQGKAYFESQVRGMSLWVQAEFQRLKEHAD